MITVSVIVLVVIIIVIVHIVVINVVVVIINIAVVSIIIVISIIILTSVVIIIIVISRGLSWFRLRARSTVALRMASGSELGAPAHLGGYIPIVEIAFRDGKWWAMSQTESQTLYEAYTNDQDGSYVHYWGEDGRDGSYKENGEVTKYSRYTIDFRTMLQRNSDNGRLRTVRITWVRPDDVVPRFTGEKPTEHS